MTDRNGFIRRNCTRAIALVAAMAFGSIASGQPFENPFDNPFDTPPPRSTPQPGAGAAPGAQPGAGVLEPRTPRTPTQRLRPRPATEAQRRPTEATPQTTPEAKKQPEPSAMDEDPFRDDPVQPLDREAPREPAPPAPDETREIPGLPESMEGPAPRDVLPSELENRVVELFTAGKFAEVVPLLETVVKEAPDQFQGWHLLGVAYRMLGRYDDAIRAFGEAAKYAYTPAELSDALLRRGVAWFYKGEGRIAVGDFEEAASASINDPRPECWKGLVLARQGRYRDAITAYSNSLRLRSNYTIARNNRGLAYLAMGELNFAIADFDEVIRETPDDASAYYKRAIALARRGDLSEAIASYTESIRLDPDFAPAYYNRGLLYRRMGDARQAEADLAKARQLNPQIQTLARPARIARR